MENQLGKPRQRGRQQSHITPMWVLCVTVALSAGTLGADTSVRASSTAPASLAKDDQALTRYRALRRMHAKSDRFDDKEAWMEAWTELDEQGFRYEIVSERGAEYVLNKVLKTVLKREQEIIAAGEADRAALTEENYVFTDDGMRQGFRHVLIKPKRKEVMLVEGRMVLSPDGSDLLRVEGKLAKNPSFWTSLVNVTRYFANIDGIRVPVSTESIAKIKFAGHSRLDVYYEYESINGRPVSTAARRTLAAALPGSAPPQ